MPHSAIVIAERSWITARVIDAWLKSGNSIAEMWCFKADHCFLRAPRGLSGALYPEWDTVRLLRRRGVKVRLCPPLKTWKEAAVEADAAGADVLMTLMTHQIIPRSLLRHFGGRAVNVHPALLPDYKGPSPRAAMLMDGKADEAGGVTFHVLTPGIDEGPIIAQRAVPFSAARDLHEWDALQAEAAAEIAVGPLIDFLDGKAVAKPQIPGSGSYHRVSLGESPIHPALRADRVALMCRAFGPSGKLRWRAADPGGHKGALLLVGRFVRVLGQPTGEAQKVSPLFIEADCADARIRMRRRAVASKLVNWFLKMRALASARSRHALARRAGTRRITETADASRA